MKSGSFNFLEPSGPLQACNGSALPINVRVVELKSSTLNWRLYYIFSYVTKISLQVSYGVSKKLGLGSVCNIDIVSGVQTALITELH